MPAAGYRNRVDGAGYNRGTEGNYWSCEVAGSNSSRLNFNGSGTNTGTNNRANGFSVRCVQAFAMPFLSADGKYSGTMSGVPEVKASGREICKFSSLPVERSTGNIGSIYGSICFTSTCLPYIHQRLLMIARHREP